MHRHTKMYWSTVHRKFIKNKRYNYWLIILYKLLLTLNHYLWYFPYFLIRNKNGSKKFWVIRNIFGLWSWFLAQAPKTLGIFWLIGVSFIRKPLLSIPEFMIIRWVRALNGLRMGLITRKSKWLQDWNFQPYPVTSEKGKEGFQLRSVKTLR